ncbi:hypothetical protein EYC80_008948 [Monilinia laxa]|uniref:Uncharacterized protein n=1 Tax=Monilinia laxa TaxID=61186 RepID=A0A5N6K1X5_MONLA|nr:hypothetical protein EYC80_008948 [Monilinia laxa]
MASSIAFLRLSMILSSEQLACVSVYLSLVCPIHTALLYPIIRSLIQTTIRQDPNIQTPLNLATYFTPFLLLLFE